MNEFDLKAAGWDNNPMHLRRAEAVAIHIKKLIPLNREMNAFEFGAGTGITSFFLAESLKHITMMDSSTGMVEIMNEKIRKTDINNLRAVHFDLEKDDYKAETFDLIFTQMVLHHITDLNAIFSKFSKLLNPNGYLAIADLYREEGLFHGTGFSGHNGFDPEELAKMLKEYNFINPEHMQCFTIAKEVAGSVIKNFNVFILTAQIKKS